MNKDHVTDFDPTVPVSEQASYWWVLLNNGTATSVEHREFGEWVARSPERVEAFLQTVRLARALKSKHIRWPDTPVEMLVRDARAAPAALPFTLPDDSPRSRFKGSESSSGRRGLRWWAALGAVPAMFAVILGSWMLLGGTQRYQTAIGEQRSVVLSDGSIVTLNTSSSIDVQFATNRRIIRLLAGEALFQVAHDRTRPFDVMAGNATVRAVGTQFNVDRRADSTAVTVVEGKVTVDADQPGSSGFEVPLRPQSHGAGMEIAGRTTSFLLSAGEGITVSPHLIPRPVPANVATATAWTQRRLVFEHRPLEEVAEEFNRYNRRTIEIASPELRDQQITGVFRANDPDSFMEFVSRIPGAKVYRTDGHTRVVTEH